MPDWRNELDGIINSRHEGRTEHVFNALLKLDQRYPNVAEINHQLAWTLEADDKTEEALPFYEKAIALGLSPNEHANALVGLGNCLRRSGRTGRAIEVLDKAHRQFPDHAEFSAYLALALFASGQRADALRMLIDVLVETSEDVGITAHQRALRYQARQLAD